MHRRLSELVDRVDRSRAMVVANAVRAVIVGVLAVGVIGGWATMPLLYLAAFTLGAAETISDSAYRAVLPAITLAGIGHLAELALSWRLLARAGGRPLKRPPEPCRVLAAALAAGRSPFLATGIPPPPAN